MSPGEINETSRALGVLQASFDGLQRTVHALAETWQRQDDAATAGRRRLYEEVGKLRTDITSLQGDVVAVNRKVDELRPIVRAGEISNLHNAGANRILRLIGRLFWTLLIAAIGAAVTAAAGLFHSGKSH